MKTFSIAPLKAGDKDEVKPVEILLSLLNTAMQGMSFDEYEERMKVRAALKEAEGPMIELEDADHQVIVNAIRNTKYVSINEDAYSVLKSVLKAETVKKAKHAKTD